MLFHPMLPFIGAWSFSFLVSFSVTNLSWHSQSMCTWDTHTSMRVQMKFYGGFVNVSDIFLGLLSS